MDTRFVCFPVKIIGLLLTLTLTIFGCQWLPATTSIATTPNRQPDESRFYPLQPGWFVVYAVTQTQYRPNQQPVTTLFQRKERVGVAFNDAAGQTAFRIERFRRAGDALPWLADSVWSARWQNNQLIRTENGIATLALVLPVYDQSRWNPNPYNSGATDPPGAVTSFYEISHANQPLTLGGFEFAASVRVQQQADSTLLGQTKRNEIYAFGVGMVYKEWVQLRFCTATDCLGKARIVTGTRQQEQILYYGLE